MTIPSNQEKNFGRYLKNRDQIKWSITADYSPPMISLPYGTKCNAKCSFCHRQSSPERIPDDHNIRSVHKQMVEFTSMASSVYLSDWGEFSVSNELAWLTDRLESMLEPDVVVGLATNGIELPQEIHRLLFSGRPRFVIVSLNAVTRKDYRESMGVDSFDEVINHIRAMVNARNNLSDPNSLSIFLSVVLTNANCEILPDFAKLAVRERVQGVLVEEFIQFDDRQGDLVLRHPESDIREVFMNAHSICNHNKIPIFSVSKAWYLNPPRQDNEFLWCEDPWRSFRVGADGAVAPCCYYKESFGNVLEGSLYETWNGDRFQQLRKEWIEGKQTGPCLDCLAGWSKG